MKNVKIKKEIEQLKNDLQLEQLGNGMSKSYFIK